MSTYCLSGLRTACMYCTQIVLPADVMPWVRMAYEEALIYWYSIPGATVSSTFARLSPRLTSLIKFNEKNARNVLRTATGYKERPPVPDPEAASGDGKSGVNLAAAIATPVGRCGCCMCLWLWMHCSLGAVHSSACMHPGIVCRRGPRLCRVFCAECRPG